MKGIFASSFGSNPLELAPFPENGCRGFKGPVPPPLMMNLYEDGPHLVRLKL